MHNSTKKRYFSNDICFSVLYFQDFVLHTYHRDSEKKQQQHIKKQSTP